MTLKEKYEVHTGVGLFSNQEFPVEDQVVIKNVLLDEIFGTTFLVIGTLIWAYG